MQEEIDVDKIISKLLDNQGKDKLLEAEVRGLCTRAR